jgi:hypothetical protein
VEEFAGVFFHVNTDEPDPSLLAVHLDLHVPVRGQGEFILGNLVTLGKVRVKVIFPGELAVGGNLAVRGQRGAHRKFNDLLIEDRKTSGEPGANRAGVSIGLGSEESGTTAEDLTSGQKLGVNFQADDRFIFHDRLRS